MHHGSAAVSPTSPPTYPAAIQSPCAACKTLRRRCCAEKCVLAPYFPPNDTLNFIIAHRIFGASNIIKLLLELPEAQRADAVNSLVYEANARLRDPVYGCTGAVFRLQKRVDELQVELARAHAEIMKMQCQNSNLLDQFHKEMQQVHQNNENYSNLFLDEGIMELPLWT